MAYSFSAGIEPSADVMFQTVGDESVILNLKTSLYLGLDPVGTRMWTLLTSAASIEDAYNSLLEEYDVPAQQLRSDLGEFLEKLDQQGLIAVKPDKPPDKPKQGAAANRSETSG